MVTLLDTNILGGNLSAIIGVPNLVQDIHYLQHRCGYIIRHKHPGGGGNLSAIIDVPNLVQDIHYLQHRCGYIIRHKHPGGGEFISNHRRA